MEKKRQETFAARVNAEMNATGNNPQKPEPPLLFGNWPDAKADRYVVFVIDLLGMGEKLGRWSTVVLEDPKTYAPIEESLRPLKHFHKKFTEFFDGRQRGRKPEVLRESLPEGEVERYLQCTDYSVGAQMFSDTFVFFARTYNARGDKSTVPVSYFLMACCLAMLESLTNGYPVRGAVSVGLGIELGTHNFFGPAFAQAHHLESKCAKYPRIVVSPETVAFAEDIATGTPDDEVQERMRRFACRVPDLLAKDTDGWFIVDYLGGGLCRSLNDEDFWKIRLGVHLAYAFAIKEEERFGNDFDVKHAYRYWRLRRYIESRLPVWDNRAKSLR